MVLSTEKCVEIVLLLLVAKNGQPGCVLELWFGFICQSSKVRNTAVPEKQCRYTSAQARLLLL